MKVKHLISICVITAGILSTASFAGYDTRGYAPSNQYSSAYFDNVHSQCMAQSRAKYPDPWRSQSDFVGFKRTYMSCERRYFEAMPEDSGYPTQPHPQPSP